MPTAALTPDEFELVFGKRLEQPAQQNTHVQRRFMPNAMGDSAALIQAVTPRVQKIDQATKQPIGQQYDAVKDTLSHVAANIDSGVLQVPTDVAGAVDLVRFGVPAVMQTVANNDPKTAWYQQVGKEFMNSVMPPEVQTKLGLELQQESLKYAQQNPQARPEDIKQHMDQFQDSDEWHSHVMSQLPLGLSIANAGNTFANKMMGLQRPDQQSAIDDIEQIIGGSIVGLPKALVSGVKDAALKAVRKQIGSVIDNTMLRAIGKTASKVGELATPGTYPYTPANIAANAATGSAINEAARGLQGEQTAINYQSLVPTDSAQFTQQVQLEPNYDPNALPKPEALGVATGVTIGAMFSFPALLRAVRRQADEEANVAVRKISSKTGQSLEEQADRMTPKLSRMTGLGDSNSPIKHIAQQYKSADDTETVPLLDALQSSASQHNRVEAENNALNYGILHGVDNTVAFADIDRAIKQLNPDEQVMLNNYVYAVQRKQDSVIYEKQLTDQIRQAEMDMRVAGTISNTQKRNAAAKKLGELQTRYQALRRDDVDTRSSMKQWSRDDVNSIISQGDANPKVRQVATAMQKLSNDLNEFAHANGLINEQEKTRRLRTRPLFVHLSERSHPDVDNPVARRALLFKDRMTHRADTDQGFFINQASRNVTGEGAGVNLPKDAHVALKETVMDAVRSVTVNNARRDIIDKLKDLDAGRGEIIRPYVFNLGNGRKSHSISEAQFTHRRADGGSFADDMSKNKIRDRFIKISRDGNVEFYEFSDPSVTKALQYAPLSSVPVFNETRKIWQSMTTGVAAPWFAAKTFLWDVPLAKVTNQNGRSLGLIDTYARRLVEGTALQKPVGAVLDNVFDPTAFASAGLAIPYSAGLRAARAVGLKIASDLEQNSGVFAAIASNPAGRRLVEWTGTQMTHAFDQSAYAVMTKNLSTSLSHFGDVSKVMDDYAGGLSRNKGFVKSVFASYKAAVESIQMATKTAFFAENYSRLKAKYNGNIPDSELQKLVQETRNLTGDMSRTSNSNFIQGLTSVVPYSNAAIQGTRHLLASSVPSPVAKGVNMMGGNMLTDRTDKFWPQFTSGVLLPYLGAMAVLSQWDGAEDWWYNKVPAWQSYNAIPMPNAAAIEHRYTTGEWPPFSPEYVNMIPLTPEFGLVLAPTVAGLRAMGIVGPAKYSTPHPVTKQLSDALNQVSSFATPPLVQAVGALGGQRIDLHGLLTGEGLTQEMSPEAGGGANADMLTHNSDVSRTLYNVIGSLSGSAGQLVLQSISSGTQALNEGEGFGEALADALDTAKFEAQRRLPTIDVPGLYNARRRSYSFTPESEYVYKTLNQLEPVIGSGRQMTVEHDGKGYLERQQSMGLDAAGKIHDPFLKAVATHVYDSLKKKGAFKEAGQGYTEVNKDIAALEASRYKASDDDVNKMRNQLVSQQQQFRHIQAQELQKLENDMRKQLGRRFIQQYKMPFSFDNLSKLVRDDVAK